MAQLVTHRCGAFLVLLLAVALSSSPTLATSPKGAGSPKAAPALAKATAQGEQHHSPLPRPLRKEDPSSGEFKGFEHTVQRIRSGDTLSRLLSRAGLSQKERTQWIQSIEKQLSPRKLPAGKKLHFYFERDASTTSPAGGKKSLRAMEMELDEGRVLSWERGSKGIVFAKQNQPQETEVKAISGVVESSLVEDGQKLGLTSGILSQLAEIFAWDVDLDRDVQQGDTFKLLYEVRTPKGTPEKSSFRILAAELVNSGRQHFAVYFEKEEGEGNYYNLYGQSLARAFLRFPLEFTRISSYFSEARYHPVLHGERPHHGVDFAADRGTPVRAVADGEIRYAGWRKGGYGRTIEVQHGDEYGSLYAHLQRVAVGMRKGTRVKRGQVIGYVGSSGRTTGPHLHFELCRGDERLNPLTFELPPEDSIDPALRTVFEDTKQLLLATLAAGQSS